MRIEVKPAAPTDRLKLQNLMQLYLYDFSEFLPLELDEQGLFKEGLLDDYFVNPSKAAFLVLADDKLAGFVLVSQETTLPENQGGRCIKEFFIARRYRRQAVGRTAAFAVFAQYQGKWEVRVLRTNRPAKAFWEKTIRDFSEAQYTCTEGENERWSGSIFSFQS